MKLVSYRHQAKHSLALLIDNSLYDLAHLHDGQWSDMKALLADTDALAALAGAEHRVSPEDGIALGDVTLLPPIERPGKVICIGKNYAEHAREGGSEPPDYPMLFHKAATSLVGYQGDVVMPGISHKIDFEGELAVVIGRDCKSVGEDEALDYVFGYTVANDVTARDWQKRTSQFTAGKMLDTFCPLGPAVVSKDEIADVQNLRLTTHLNGEKMQDGNTKDMVFSVAFLVSYISQICTLEVGDLILTGTPEGVGFARKPPVWMKAGDRVRVEVEGLGVLENPVV